MIPRTLQTQITEYFDSANPKIVILLGARQIGKTTLMNALFEGRGKVLRLNGDDPTDRALIESANTSMLKAIIGDCEYVVIDEAQRIKDIGLKLKIIADNFPQVKILSSGSSAFELSDSLGESLAGRKKTFRMFSLSCGELCADRGMLEELRSLHSRLIFGSYPEIVTSVGNERKLLLELIDAVLYKDILSYGGIKKSDKIVSLLRALAFQTGSQVSFNELGSLCGLSSKTVESYIDILEKAYIIFTLGSYSRNLRNELKFSKKIYFYDNGIRNALINNFSPIELRSDKEKGALWENYLISERIKANAYSQKSANIYFWRTKGQQEIDYIEETDGRLEAFEFKWNPLKSNAKAPKSFLETYQGATFKVVTPENYFEFLR